MSTSSYFFSYTRDDEEFALRLAKDLRDAGADVWIDQIDIAAGERWDRSVETALEESANMILVLSPDSVQSNNVMDEVSFALDEGKRIVPVMYRACELPFRIRRLQHISFVDDYDSALAELLEDLNVVAPSGRSEGDEVQSPDREAAETASGAGQAARSASMAARSKRAWILPVVALAVLAGIYIGIRSSRSGDGESGSGGTEGATEGATSEAMDGTEGNSAAEGSPAADAAADTTEPAESAVTNVRLAPASPARLRHGEDVQIQFDYSTSEDAGVRIFLRPMTQGAPTAHYAASGSPLYPAGSGRGEAEFTVQGRDAVLVDQIRVQMNAADRTQVVHESFVPVRYAFGTATPAPQEDCLGFVPGNLRVISSGARWVLTDGRSRMKVFDDRAEADQTLRIIQRYGMNRHCFVGRPDPSLEYWLTAAGSPSGSMSGEDCIGFSLDRLQLVEEPGGWLMTGGRSRMRVFPNKEEAESALAVIKHYRFNQTCYVGRPNPSMTYLRN